jgi:hypothetical protein
VNVPVPGLYLRNAICLIVEKKNQGNKSGMTAVKGSHSVLFGSTISAELGVYFEFRTATETEFGI